MQKKTQEMIEPNLLVQVKKLRVQQFSGCPNITEVRREPRLLPEVIQIACIC